MPRANRYIVARRVYHITHRCHNRDFLFRFAKDRDTYRRWLREGLGRYPICLLGYCITSNHVHLILFSENERAVSRLMQLLEGCVGQQYNRRKKRGCAFWEDRYHCTMVDGGRYLLNCMKYMDLNMIRAGVVDRPEDWRWGGYQEFMGLRKRYCVLDVAMILNMLNLKSVVEMREQYMSEMDEALSQASMARDPMWTESLAVGSRGFVDELKPHFKRQRLVISEIGKTEQDARIWTVREDRAAYS